jgi:hypothetical protein
MSIILGIFTLADSRQPLIDKRKRRGQWSVGKWLGAILYDYLTHPDESQLIQEKWATYIVRVRRDEAAAEQASILGGAQNLTATRYKRICTKVEIYLRDRRIATDEELAGIRHDEEEDDDISVVSDERED